MALISLSTARQVFDSVSTSVASAAVVTELLPENTKRLGATIYNDSTKILFVKLGAGASDTSFSAKLGVGGYFEVPFGYAGIVTGIWSTANGFARITEFVE